MNLAAIDFPADGFILGRVAIDRPLDDYCGCPIEITDILTSPNFPVIMDKHRSEYENNPTLKREETGDY